MVEGAVVAGAEWVLALDTWGSQARVETCCCTALGTACKLCNLRQNAIACTQCVGGAASALCQINVGSQTTDSKSARYLETIGLTSNLEAI